MKFSGLLKSSLHISVDAVFMVPPLLDDSIFESPLLKRFAVPLPILESTDGGERHRLDGDFYLTSMSPSARVKLPMLPDVVAVLAQRVGDFSCDLEEKLDSLGFASSSL